MHNPNSWGKGDAGCGATNPHLQCSHEEWATGGKVSWPLLKRLPSLRLELIGIPEKVSGAWVSQGRRLPAAPSRLSLLPAGL